MKHKILLALLILAVSINIVSALTIQNVTLASGTNQEYINGSMITENITINITKIYITNINSSFDINGINGTTNTSLITMIAPYQLVYSLTNMTMLSQRNANYNLSLQKGYSVAIDENIQNVTIYAPNILMKEDVNTLNYWDRQVKYSFGGIYQLPLVTEDISSMFITSTANRRYATGQNITITIPLNIMLEAYQVNLSRNLSIDNQSLRLYYSGIYGGRIGQINFSYVIN